MTTTGLSAFETTVHKTNAWLKEIMEEMGWDDRHRAYIALRAVLRALRDRMTIQEVADFSAQLPMLVRGIFYDGWQPTGKPVKFDLEDFMDIVWSEFNYEPGLDPEQIVRAVLSVAKQHVTEGEIADIKDILPRDFQDFLEV
ncbi:MAG: DUF2267 domain-containing protein [Dehalococcoidia bacterium]|nr:DUF2267 domain-containing protein [Dehalococcoidia bacterium]